MVGGGCYHFVYEEQGKSGPQISQISQIVQRGAYWTLGYIYLSSGTKFKKLPIKPSAYTNPPLIREICVICGPLLLLKLSARLSTQFFFNSIQPGFLAFEKMGWGEFGVVENGVEFGFGGRGVARNCQAEGQAVSGFHAGKVAGDG